MKKMKNYGLAIMMLLGGLTSGAMAQVKTSAQEVATLELAEKREVMKTNILNDYLGIKNSLVVSDGDKTARYAKSFISVLKQFKFKKLTLDQMNAATSTRATILVLAEKIATEKIDTQRKEFVELSTQLWTIIDLLKPEGLMLYHQRCPMVGSTWVSDSKEIKNPYFPKNMLTCGEVISTK